MRLSLDTESRQNSQPGLSLAPKGSFSKHPQAHMQQMAPTSRVLVSMSQITPHPRSRLQRSHRRPQRGTHRRARRCKSPSSPSPGRRPSHSLRTRPALRIRRFPARWRTSSPRMRSARRPRDSRHRTAPGRRAAPRPTVRTWSTSSCGLCELAVSALCDEGGGRAAARLTPSDHGSAWSSPASCPSCPPSFGPAQIQAPGGIDASPAACLRRPW